nr:hypothetical protein [Geotalea toluenoxydans]
MKMLAKYRITDRDIGLVVTVATLDAGKLTFSAERVFAVIGASGM